MEELLPLIIGIIWLVYTIFTKGKKKEVRKQSAGEHQEAKEPSVLEQLFSNGEFMEPQPYETYDEPIDDEITEPYEMVLSEEDNDAAPFLKAELSNFMHEGQSAVPTSMNFTDEDLAKHENQVEMPDFDLRKAIIYSEILNAPYIGYK
jgi:hypothetical protein